MIYRPHRANLNSRFYERSKLLNRINDIAVGNHDGWLDHQFLTREIRLTGADLWEVHWYHSRIPSRLLYLWVLSEPALPVSSSC